MKEKAQAGGTDFQTITIKDDFIRLGQALKFANLVENGGQAKFEIQGGKVKVNGEINCQRGKKLVGGDEVSYGGVTLKILQKE
ncbi:MAG: RNA-binding S4 domain-containing protein [Lachnospiraceae bacterium]|jgi:ribosome-associated protein|nr:RNA-binding S4 domain-containing protein [Lachnospiraceae bacterium]